MKRKFISVLLILMLVMSFGLAAPVMAEVVEYDSELILENKDADWQVIGGDATHGTLEFNQSGSEFEYRLTASGLEDGVDYSIIYYADKPDRFADWGGNNPGALIGTFTYGASPTVTSGSVELGMSLPCEPDANISEYDYTNSEVQDPPYATAHGAKIWVVPSVCYVDNDEQEVITWSPTRFLFETDLIAYTWEPRVVNDNTGEGFNAIQDAIDDGDTLAGHTISVTAGIYNENVVISPDKDGLQLVGAGSSDTTIAPVSGRPVALGGNLGLIDGIRVEGFTLVPAGASHAFIALSGTNDGNTYTTNLELEDIVVDGGQRGIGLNAANGITLTDVHLSDISGSGEAALELTGVFGLSFVDGSFEENDIGIRLQPTGVGQVGDGYGSNGNLQVHDSNFCGNIVAIENQSSVEINATNNWWCHSSGPHASPGFGDPVLGIIDFEPWLLTQGGDPYDGTATLNPGWSIVSPGAEIASYVIVADSDVLMYKYDGGFIEATDMDAITPVFIKTANGGGIGFDYTAESMGMFSTDLEAGWNLIGVPATVATSEAILSSIRLGANNEVALATLASQGNYNPSGVSFYDSMLDIEYAPKELFPFDGYWAYMNVAKEFGVIVVE